MASVRSLSSPLKKLDIGASSVHAAQRKQPAESWEDDADSDDSSDTETESQPPKTPKDDMPGAPPPTPSSPSFSSQKTATGYPYQTFPPYGFDGQAPSDTSDSKPRAAQRGEAKRPETSMAVASRLIAAGIGQKAPRRTAEQRQYDQAMKVQEKKKRDAGKEEEERKRREKEKALKDVWGD